MSYAPCRRRWIPPYHRRALRENAKLRAQLLALQRREFCSKSADCVLFPKHDGPCIQAGEVDLAAKRVREVQQANRNLRRRVKALETRWAVVASVVERATNPCYPRKKCCARAGEYNSFASDGPTTFTCPKNCACHD